MKKSVRNNKLSVLDIAILGVMVATMTSFKYAMSLLPNIEPVSLLIILYTLFLGPKVIYAIIVFVLVEGLIYGFGSWWFSYLYIWPILAILTHFIGKKVTVCFGKPIPNSKIKMPEGSKIKESHKTSALVMDIIIEMLNSHLKNPVKRPFMPASSISQKGEQNEK